MRAEALDEKDEGKEADRDGDDLVNDGRLGDSEASNGAEQERQSTDGRISL